jgi:murein endopeptidase
MKQIRKSRASAGLKPGILIAAIRPAGSPRAPDMPRLGPACAQPSVGPPQVIGGVSNGCIGGADALPETGPGYVSIRRFRNRYYGHPELLRFVKTWGGLSKGATIASS